MCCDFTDVHIIKKELGTFFISFILSKVVVGLEFWMNKNELVMEEKKKEESGTWTNNRSHFILLLHVMTD
jgi:hypothetical protein